MMKLAKQLVCILAVATAAWAQDLNAADSVAAMPADSAAVTSIDSVVAMPVDSAVAKPVDSVAVKPVESVAAKSTVDPPVKKVRSPCEHRGMFFSAGLGFSYAGLAYKDYRYDHMSNTYFNNVWAGSFNEGSQKTWDYDSFEIPTIDIRLGRSFANLFSIYALLSAGAYNGNAEYTFENIEQTKNPGENGGVIEEVKTVGEPDKQEYSAMYARFSFGLGFAVYPFRNRASSMNGFYFAFAGGIDSWTARLEGNLDSFDKSGVFTRYEIGKDWWMSETWSIGVGFVFTNVSSFFEDYDGRDSGHARTLGLFFRVTRG